MENNNSHLKARIAFHLFVLIPAKFFYLFGYITLCGFFGLGDICYELALIDEYKNKKRKKIRVVCRKKRCFIFYYYPAIDKISYISSKIERIILSLHPGFDIYSRKQRKSILHVCHSFYHYHLKNPSMIEKMRLVYKLKENVKLTFPMPYQNTYDNRYLGFVLVNKTSNSYESNKINFFIDNVSSMLVSQGFNVIHNSKDIDLNYLLCNAHYFSAVISIRSGILDFLVNSNAKIICLYGKDEHGINLKEKWGFSLKEWRGSSKILEYYVEDLSEVDIIKAIMN